jgi:hypothetical protein
VGYESEAKAGELEGHARKEEEGQEHEKNNYKQKGLKLTKSFF